MKIVLPSATTQSSTQCSQNHHSIGHATKFQFTLAAIAETTILVPYLLSQVTATHGSGTCRSHIDGLVQERRNSTANALELRLSCTNPSISRCPIFKTWQYDRGIGSGFPKIGLEKIQYFFQGNIKNNPPNFKDDFKHQKWKKVQQVICILLTPLRATLTSKTYSIKSYRIWFAE